jgi:hypothetical protein
MRSRSGVFTRMHMTTVMSCSEVCPEKVRQVAGSPPSGAAQFGWGNVQPQGTRIFNLPKSSNHGVTQPVP